MDVMVVSRTCQRLALGAAAVGGVAAAVQAAPMATSLRRVRMRWWPGLAGVGAPDHVALTFDDGPDAASTPRFLELLAARGVRATFFLLGSMTERHAGLAAEIAAAGHEVAVHGFAHRNLMRRSPAATRADLQRAVDVIGAATGSAPVHYRPPYGLLTAAALDAARGLALRPVLWTAWGEDWSATATPESVLRTVRRDLTGGGTVLLHDSDCTSAPLSWRSALGALPDLLDGCARAGWRVGPLSEHGRAA
jgi:peptidoglycan/xylan/chitin deacetylase (PgdA/CDA1 family)